MDAQFSTEPAVGLKAILVVDNTAAGPSIGGIRMAVDIEYFFGNPGDIAVSGDFDTNRLGANNEGLGAAELSFPFGDVDFAPFAGNFDADQPDELGYYVPTSAGDVLNVFLHFDLSNGTPDASFLYGKPDDIGFAGDWDGDGEDTIAVYRPAERFGPAAATFYLRNSNTTGIGEVSIPPFGDPSWTPLHGRFGLG